MSPSPSPRTSANTPAEENRRFHLRTVSLWIPVTKPVFAYEKKTAMFLVLSNIELIELLALQREAATDKLVEKIVKHDSWPIQPDILSPPLLRLTPRKPLWLDLQPVDIKSRCRHNWKSAQVVNSHLVCDTTSGNRLSTSLYNSGLC